MSSLPDTCPSIAWAKQRTLGSHSLTWAYGVQVLAPTFPIYSQLANSSSLTSEAKLFINQVLIPLSTLLPQVNAASTTANLITPGPVSSA